MSRVYKRIVQFWTAVFVLMPIKVYAAIAAGGALPSAISTPDPS